MLRWRERILLCRHEKPGKEYWLLPGGGVESGESLIDALHRELREEVGIEDELPFEGPVAIVDSIAPQSSASQKHVVHIIFAGDLGGRTSSASPRRTRPCAATGSSPSTSSTTSSCTRRSSASCAAGGRATRLSTSASSGRRDVRSTRTMPSRNGNHLRRVLTYSGDR